MGSHYLASTKQAAITKFENGSTAKEICAELGISRSTLFFWVKESKPDNQAPIPRQLYLELQELEHLRKENSIYKSCGCSPYSPLDMRLLSIHQHKNEYSIHSLCRALQVNRATYYNYASRFNKKTKIQIEDEQLKPLISEIFDKSGNRFGARKIRAKLQIQGYVVSERRILRLMKELNISSKPQKTRINSANDRQYRYYPNMLNRNFDTKAPNTIWVSDITFVKVGYEFLYLCVIIDLFSRKVVAYNISDSINSELVTQTFLDAYKTRGYPKSLTFHSDRGTQYTSNEFCSLLKANRVIQSFSAPGTPHDNAVAESFFATIKKEDFRRTWYQTKDEFQVGVDRYIDYYNDYRPHQSFNQKTPNQVENEYFEVKNT